MITIQDVQTRDEKALISDWYFEEWTIPKEETLRKLSSLPNQDILFQRILYFEREPVATGGLYLRVGIQERVPRYRETGPWIGLMYTKPAYRGKGLGRALLEDIEARGNQNEIPEIFLFTHSADRLYRRNSWQEIEQIKHGENTIVVMKKTLSK